MNAGIFKRAAAGIFKKSDDEKMRKALANLESEQQEMIKGVVELSATVAKEVMVPRIDAVCLSVDASQADIFALISESEHSRFPVYKDTIDNVVGILYVKDLLKSLIRGDTFDIQKLVRKPFFVPESKHIDILLRELRRRKVHIAVVVDEYGGVSGIVCMEDIIEEIIGEIQDEFDNETDDIVKLGEGVYLCDARVNLEDLSEEIGIEFPFQDFDTLGGFIFDLRGQIPIKYEKVVYGGNDFIIQDMDGHKINKVKIVIKKKNEG